MNTRAKFQYFFKSSCYYSWVMPRSRAGRVQFSLPFAMVCVTAMCLVSIVCAQLIRIHGLEMERNWMLVNSDVIAVDNTSALYVKNTSPNLPFSWVWNVHLPEGREYWLHIRINSIPKSEFPAAAEKGSPVQLDGNTVGVAVTGSHFVKRLVPGRGSIGLCWRHLPKEGWQACLVTAESSMNELIPVSKDLQWLDPVSRGEEVFLIKDHQDREHSLPIRYDMSGVGVYSYRHSTSGVQEEFAADQNVELIRMRSVPLGTSGVCDGFLVWISTDHPFEDRR